MSKTEFAEAGVEGLFQLAGLALPGVGLLGSKMAALVVAEHERRVSKALRAAERISGLSREEIGDKLAANPAAIPMLVKLLHAAGNNGHDRILQTMGAVYARVLIDPSELEFEELILLSISNLEDIHVVLLTYLESKESRLAPDVLAGELALPPDLVRLALTGLFTASLVELPFGGFGGGDAYEINAIGRLVLKAVREATT